MSHKNNWSIGAQIELRKLRRARHAGTIKAFMNFREENNQVTYEFIPAEPIKRLYIKEGVCLI